MKNYNIWNIISTQFNKNNISVNVISLLLILGGIVYFIFYFFNTNLDNNLLPYLFDISILWILAYAMFFEVVSLNYFIFGVYLLKSSDIQKYFDFNNFVIKSNIDLFVLMSFFYISGIYLIIYSVYLTINKR